MHASVVLISLFVIFVAVVVFFRILNWRTAKTYKPTKDEVLEILDAVLSGRVTYLQWDTFICVPIRHDQKLEAVRVEVSALDQDRTLFAGTGQKWRGDAGFNELGLQRIEQIRDTLRGEIRS